MQLTLKELRKAISESSHSDFCLPDSRLNEYSLLIRLNFLLKEKDIPRCPKCSSAKISCRNGCTWEIE